MLTEVMRHYGLARPPVDAGFFETEHHAQVSRDIRNAILGGRLIALTAVIGSGKTVLSRRLRADLEGDGRVIVSRSLIDKPRLPDLLVDSEVVRRRIASEKPNLVSEAPSFAPLNIINKLMRHNHGPNAAPSPDQYRLTVHLSFIQHIVHRQVATNGAYTIVRRHFHVGDIVKLVVRYLNGDILTPYEAAVFTAAVTSSRWFCK